MLNTHRLISHMNNSIQRVAKFAASASPLKTVGWAALAMALAMPVQAAQAKDTQQGALNACKVNGQLVVPAAAPGKTAWMFVVNFDQPPSQTTVMGCLATRSANGAVSYAPDRYCSVANNTAGRQFGGGVAQFDGNAVIECTIDVGSEVLPPRFWMHARANFPSTLKGDTFPLVTSAPLSFAVHTDAACLLKLDSRYNDITFAHPTLNQCGSFVDVESNLVQGGPAPQGTHRVRTTNSYGPTSAQGSFSLPTHFVFAVGAVGKVYSLDWLVIDPPGNCCNPN